MMIKDVMPSFELFQPTQLKDAFALLDRYGKDSWKMPGVYREHALFDSDRCVAVSQSDTAPALVALDAKFVVKSAKGERVIGSDEFFIGPKIDITRMTSLAHDEILTAIRISNAWAGAHFYFEKVADRNTWDFPLVNVAAAMSVKNGVIENCRIACGGVRCVPRPLTAAEGVVKGKPAGGNIAQLAGQSATRGASPPRCTTF